MKKYFTILIIFLSFLQLNAQETNDSAKYAFENQPKSLTLDFSSNKYAHSFFVSGINLRIIFVGIGIHSVPNDGRLTGHYYDMQIYYDIGPVSIYGLVGSGSTLDRKDKYTGMTETETGNIFGCGLHASPWEGFVAGFRWDTMNKISIQFGWGK